MRVLNFIIFLAAMTASAATPNTSPIDLALDWKPEAEFGGFYEADAKGFYSKAGVSTKIIQGGAGQPVAQMVGAKKVKFGIVSGDGLILARANGAKIVAIFAVYQNDPQGFLVHSERKFKSLKDLFQSEGTLALEKGRPDAEWLQKKYGPLKVKLVPYTGGITQYLRDQSYSQQCFVTSEPIAARRELARDGKASTIQTLLISESGFNAYKTVVAVHEDTLKNEPEMVKKWVKATQEAWASYLKNPKETNVLMQKLNPSIDVATLNESAEIQKPFIETAETKKEGLGFMTVERWDALQKQLLEIKLIKSLTAANTFFKNL